MMQKSRPGGTSSARWSCSRKSCGTVHHCRAWPGTWPPPVARQMGKHRMVRTWIACSTQYRIHVQADETRSNSVSVQMCNLRGQNLCVRCERWQWRRRTRRCRLPGRICRRFAPLRVAGNLPGLRCANAVQVLHPRSACVCSDLHFDMMRVCTLSSDAAALLHTSGAATLHPHPRQRRDIRLGKLGKGAAVRRHHDGPALGPCYCQPHKRCRHPNQAVTTLLLSELAHVSAQSWG